MFDDAMSTRVWSGAGVVLGGTLLFWACRCSQSSSEKLTMAEAAGLVKVEMQQQQAMWQGTKMAVDAVKQTADRLGSLEESLRIGHRQRLTKQMLQELWTMSIAVDEMIVRLSQPGCFPHNYSVRNMVTPARYDKILGAFKQVSGGLKQPMLGGA